jgi:hypothetical protein
VTPSGAGTPAQDRTSMSIDHETVARCIMSYDLTHRHRPKTCPQLLLLPEPTSQWFVCPVIVLGVEPVHP